MSHEAAFLHALAANPYDDTTRLVYADWLDEHGDPRSEYIRLEVQLAGTLPEDAEYQRRLQCLRMLRDGIDRAWVDTAGRPYNVVIRRYEEDDHRMIVDRVHQLLGGDRRAARRLVDAIPCIVLRGLPFWSAEVASWRIRGGRDLQTGAIIGNESALAYTVVVPAGVGADALTARPRTREEAMSVMRAEARQLGLTLDELLRPEHCNNRLLKSALSFFAADSPS